ncbi:DNL zinc finger-domain-containing protein, partial [Dimargaris cristalligena]
RLFIRFVCKVCNTPTQKLISKQAYTDGVVLIQCSSCKNRHLIADNKGWFRDQRVNVEDLMKEKGEAVR